MMANHVFALDGWKWRLWGWEREGGQESLGWGGGGKEEETGSRAIFCHDEVHFLTFKEIQQDALSAAV